MTCRTFVRKDAARQTALQHCHPATTKSCVYHVSELLPLASVQLSRKRVQVNLKVFTFQLCSRIIVLCWVRMYFHRNTNFHSA